MCNGRALVSARSLFSEIVPVQAQNLLTHSYHRDGESWGKQSLSRKYLQKNCFPLAIEGSGFRGGERATPFLWSVRFHKFLRLESCFFKLGYSLEKGTLCQMRRVRKMIWETSPSRSSGSHSERSRSVCETVDECLGGCGVFY